jgi:hypothetical protein
MEYLTQPECPLQSNVYPQNNPVVSDICQRLNGEQRGDLDFEVDDGAIPFIQSEDDFRRKLQDYERSNDHLQHVVDFPTDPASLQRSIKKICRALTDWDPAINLRGQSDEDFCFAGNIKILRKTEVKLLAWMVLVSFHTTLRDCDKCCWICR